MKAHNSKTAESACGTCQTPVCHISYAAVEFAYAYDYLTREVEVLSNMCTISGIPQHTPLPSLPVQELPPSTTLCILPCKPQNGRKNVWQIQTTVAHMKNLNSHAAHLTSHSLKYCSGLHSHFQKGEKDRSR